MEFDLTALEDFLLSGGYIECGMDNYNDQLTALKLIFWDSLDRLRDLAEIDDGLSDEEKSAEVFREIHRFCEDHNFKIYYTRTWVEPINGEQMTISDRS